MTTNLVVADGVIAKRKPTTDEMETLLVGCVPDLIRRFKEGGLDPAGVNTSLQMILEGVVITEQKMVVVTQPKPKPDKFELLTTFELTVPENYDHTTRLDSFKTARESEFHYYNLNLADANFNKATTQLTPGRKFQVKIFGIKSGKSVSSKECLAKIKSENGILVGAQGASIAYEQGKDKLPKGKGHISFDEKDALWLSDGRHQVPYVFAFPGGVFEFHLDCFEGAWGDDDCLLCFCDLPETSVT